MNFLQTTVGDEPGHKDLLWPRQRCMTTPTHLMLTGSSSWTVQPKHSERTGHDFGKSLPSAQRTTTVRLPVELGLPGYMGHTSAVRRSLSWTAD